MTNPFRKHASNLFATHGSNIDGALDYANALINAMSGADRAAATTAIMVLVNTAAEAFDKVPAAAPAGPSPERLVLIELIRSEINHWEENELEGRLNRWAQDELDLDAAIESWADSNMEDKIQEALGGMEATVSFR